MHVPPTPGLRLIQSIAPRQRVLLGCQLRAQGTLRATRLWWMGFSNVPSAGPAPFQLGPTGNVALVEKSRMRVCAESTWTGGKHLGSKRFPEGHPLLQWQEVSGCVFINTQINPSMLFFPGVKTYEKSVNAPFKARPKIPLSNNSPNQH